MEGQQTGVFEFATAADVPRLGCADDVPGAARLCVANTEGRRRGRGQCADYVVYSGRKNGETAFELLLNKTIV